MNDVVRIALAKIIARHARPPQLDVRKCKGLLLDYLRGEYKKEINVLVSTLREQVVADLLASGTSIPAAVLLTRCTRKLQDQTGITENLARWSVESWASALGVIVPETGNVAGKSTISAPTSPQAWYYLVDKVIYGPLPFAELKKLAATGQLSPANMVWKEGMAKWVHARTIKGFFPAAALGPAPSAPISPIVGQVAGCARGKIGDIIEVPLTSSLKMKFAWCPPGTFLMGSPPEEELRGCEELQHRVTLSHGFYLGIYPVTQAQWQAVMGDNPSRFKGDDRPVERLLWYDCQAFCVKLGQLTGKRFRLPTEAEWEYACRAGTTTPFYFGDTINTDQANYAGCTTYGRRGKEGVWRERTTRVGRFPANAWGLFDMHGNVSEWCQDWYQSYPEDDIKDPRPERGYGSTHVVRGGSWYDSPNECRSAHRSIGTDSRNETVGCRLVLCLDESM